MFTYVHMPVQGRIQDFPKGGFRPAIQKAGGKWMGGGGGGVLPASGPIRKAGEVCVCAGLLYASGRIQKASGRGGRGSARPPPPPPPPYPPEFMVPIVRRPMAPCGVLLGARDALCLYYNTFCTAMTEGITRLLRLDI